VSTPEYQHLGRCRLVAAAQDGDHAEYPAVSRETILSSTRPANHHRSQPVGDRAGQPPSRVVEQYRSIAAPVIGVSAAYRRRWGLPRPEAPLRLVGAVLVEADDGWQADERRYLSEGSMVLFTKAPTSSEGLATPALLKA
jgi:hypothetical protein